MFLSVILPQVYLGLHPEVNLNKKYLVEAVVIPIILATGLFLGIGRKTTWLAFMAYIWAVTEDAPVYLDSVFTWPEVTSGFQHIFLEVVFHVLTFGFMVLALLEALPRSKSQRFGSIIKASLLRWKSYLAFVLLLSSFILSYAQNLPLPQLESISGDSWYKLDIVEHILSIVFLYIAIRVAASK